MSETAIHLSELMLDVLPSGDGGGPHAFAHFLLDSDECLMHFLLRCARTDSSCDVAAHFPYYSSVLMVHATRIRSHYSKFFLDFSLSYLVKLMHLIGRVVLWSLHICCCSS